MCHEEINDKKKHFHCYDADTDRHASFPDRYGK